jgi:hypothetical protein
LFDPGIPVMMSLAATMVVLAAVVMDLRDPYSGKRIIRDSIIII